MDRRVRKGLKVQKVPWGRRVRRGHKAIQEIPVDPQGHKVRKGWMVRQGHRGLKAQKVPWGRKVQPDPKVIPEDPQGQPVPRAQTAPQDRKALKVQWAKSAQPT